MEDEMETEMEMEMEEEEMDEEHEIIEVYSVVEVDFDYEFDAPRFFDFTRPESLPEVRLSEAWFSTAPNYPPSPFVAKMFQREEEEEEEEEEEQALEEESSKPMWTNVASGMVFNAGNSNEDVLGGACKGLTFYNHMANDMKKTKTKSFAKSHYPRSSTLMKPTASQMAKQNQRHQVCDSRSQKNDCSLTSQPVENQASKRQKLDGGLLRRIVDMKQPVNFVHKVPQKVDAVPTKTAPSKLRITISREPALETARRAERIRSTGVRDVGNPTATTYSFKARPLNRKILEAPVHPIPKRTTPHLPDFQAFRLKTTDRAKHYASATTSTSNREIDKGLNKASTNLTQEIGRKDGKRLDSNDAKVMDTSQPVHSFKARPLDRKILASRGDIGVFRNSKRDVTVPKMFEFQTAKRSQQNPPSDLFSKLSLAGESKSCAQTSASSQVSSKENRWEPYKHHQIQGKLKPDMHSGRQIQSVDQGGINDRRRRIGMNRSFGVWRQ